jgi:cytochrome b561
MPPMVASPQPCSIPAYSIPARLLHWIAAIAIVAAFFLGLAMLRVAPGPTQNRLFGLHESLGATVLALTALRLLSRAWRRPLPLPPATPGRIRAAAPSSHAALYALMLAQPIVGWLGASAFGAVVNVFGLFDLPVLLHADKALAAALFQIHRFGAFTLAGLVTLHVGAALFHLLVRRDGVFRRMVG